MYVTVGRDRLCIILWHVVMPPIARGLTWLFQPLPVSTVPNTGSNQSDSGHRGLDEHRKGQQQRSFTIKMKDSDEIITEPEAVKTCWTDYFSNLLSVDTQGSDEIGESRFEDLRTT